MAYLEASDRFQIRMGSLEEARKWEPSVSEIPHPSLQNLSGKTPLCRKSSWRKRNRPKRICRCSGTKWS